MLYRHFGILYCACQRTDSAGASKFCGLENRPGVLVPELSIGCDIACLISRQHHFAREGHHRVEWNIEHEVLVEPEFNFFGAHFHVSYQTHFRFATDEEALGSLHPLIHFVGVNLVRKSGCRFVHRACEDSSHQELSFQYIRFDNLFQLLVGQIQFSVSSIGSMRRLERHRQGKCGPKCDCLENGPTRTRQRACRRAPSRHNTMVR